MTGARDVAKHVVKFDDGSYLGTDFTRVRGQDRAHRWLTWASAKMIADSANATKFPGAGGRAVRLVPRRCPLGLPHVPNAKTVAALRASRTKSRK